MADSSGSFVLQIPSSWKKKIAASKSDKGRVLVPENLVRSNFHRVRVQGTVTMHDYEWLEPDKQADFPFFREGILATEGPSLTLQRWEQGFGGEERVEMDFICSLSSTSHACLVKIAIRFFEGATEGTDELEDSQVFDTIVPEGHTSSFDVLLANEEDDWARVVGSIANSPVP